MNSALHDPHHCNAYPEEFCDYLVSPQNYARALAFNRTGSLLATGCSNGVLVVWDFETGHEVIALNAHAADACVNHVAFDHSGRYVVSVAADASVAVCDLHRRVRIGALQSDGVCTFVSALPAAGKMQCVLNRKDRAPQLLEWRMRDTVRAKTEDSAVDSKGGGDGAAGAAASSAASADEAMDDDGSLVEFTVTDLGLGDEAFAVYHPTRSDLLLCHRLGEVFGRTLSSGADTSYCVLRRSKNRGFVRLLPGADGLHCVVVFQDQVFRVALAAGTAPRLYLLEDSMRIQSACASSDGFYLVASPVKPPFKLGVASLDAPLPALTIPCSSTKSLMVSDVACDLAWHPRRAVVVCCSLHYGALFVWRNTFTESWNTYMPDFEELNANRLYDEPEDEFDTCRVPPKPLGVLSTKEADEGDVDVTAVSSDEEGEQYMPPVLPKDLVSTREPVFIDGIEDVRRNVPDSGAYATSMAGTVQQIRRALLSQFSRRYAPKQPRPQPQQAAAVAGAAAAGSASAPKRSAVTFAEAPAATSSTGTTGGGSSSGSSSSSSSSAGDAPAAAQR